MALKSEFLRSLAKAFVKYGGNIVGGGVAGNVLVDVWQAWEKQKKSEPERKAELEALARQPTSKIATDVAQVVREVAQDQPPEVQEALSVYLREVPETIRRSLDQPAGPNGASLLATMSLAGAQDLATLLPSQPAPGGGLDFLARPEAPDELGRLAHYRVLKEIGRGGMGCVLLAEDTKLQRQLALKVMLPRFAEDAAARDRFLHEARAAAAIEHDNIVAIHEVGEDRGVPYIAMPLLKGLSLEDFLKQRAARGKPLKVTEICKIGREMARGLAAAHERGLVHRDIKPANVWLEDRREPGASATGARVKILDFGLAREARQAAGQHLTQAGAVLGTPAYMAPEQARGGQVDARTDLFSLGVVLYRLCTGVLPFQGTDTISVLMAVSTHERTPPRSLRTDLPPGLSDLVMRLLAKDAAQRPASAREVEKVIAAIERNCLGAVSSSPPRLPGGAGDTVAVEKPRAAPRHRLILGLAGGAVVAAAVVAFVLLRPPGGGTKTTGPGQEPEGGTEPLSPVALVSRPAALPGGAQSWTIETRLPRRPVRALAFHPTDGGLATAGDDGTIRVYDAATGKLRRAFVAGHSAGRRNEGLRALAWSPNGKVLAAGGADRKVRLWDLKSGRVLWSFEGISGAANCLAWSPDGKVLAAGDDARVRFLDPGTGKQLSEINPEVRSVWSLAWSAGGKWLAIAGRAGQYDTRNACIWAPGVGRYQALPYGASPTWGTSAQDRWVLTYTTWDKACFWDAEKRKPAGELKPSSPVFMVVPSPNGKMLASAGPDGVHVWSSPEHKPLRNWGATFQGSDEARTLTWSPDGKTVAYADLGAIWLRDVTAERSLSIGMHGFWEQAGSLSPDGAILATLHADYVKVWDVPQARFQQNLRAGGLWFRLPSWSSTNLLAIASHWGLRGNPATVVLALPSGRTVGGDGVEASFLSWSPDGDSLLAREVVGGGPRWGLVVRPAANLKKALHAPPQGLADTGPLAWSPDSKSVAGRAADKTDVVRIWSVPGGEMRSLEGHKGAVRTVAFCPPGGQLLASGGNDGMIRLWDLKGDRKFEPLKGHAGPVAGLRWAPDGAALASTGEDGSLRIWDAAAGKLRHVLIKGTEPPMMAWARDSKRIAARQGAKLFLWDAETGQLLHEMTTATPLYLLAFSQGDRELVAGPVDGRVDLWDTATGKLRCTLVNLRGDQWLAVSREGHYDGHAGIENELVYVVETSTGQETLTPAEFASQYGWKNEPDKLRRGPE